MGIDAAYGIGSLKQGVCTSSTRPASPFEGQMVYETDTDTLLVYNGSAWVCITPKSGHTDTQENTTSATFVSLTNDPSVSIQTGTKALVTIAVRHILIGGGAGYCTTSYVVSGATTLAASEGKSAQNYIGSADLGNDRSASFTYMQTGLTAGVNTFRMQHKSGSGALYATQRSITVVGIP